MLLLSLSRSFEHVGAHFEQQIPGSAADLLRKLGWIPGLSDLSDPYGLVPSLTLDDGRAAPEPVFHLLTLSKLRPDRAEQERVKAWNKLRSSPETGKSSIGEATGHQSRQPKAGRIDRSSIFVNRGRAPEMPRRHEHDSNPSPIKACRPSGRSRGKAPSAGVLG